MIASRTVLPEMLDALPPDDPEAQGSRRDLTRINGLMGNARIVASLLAARPPGRLLEIGAGDGRFALSVVRRLGQGSVALLDRQAAITDVTRAGFGAVAWGLDVVKADAFDYLRNEGEPFAAVFANLFLHHFETESLQELFRLVTARTGLFVACEPARSTLGLTGTRLLGAIGCNAVTRHDARVSVLAGFCDAELSALWPSEGWTLEERSVAPFSHTFRAERRP